jgi:hypothetical protein
MPGTCGLATSTLGAGATHLRKPGTGRLRSRTVPCCHGYGFKLAMGHSGFWMGHIWTYLELCIYYNVL